MLLPLAARCRAEASGSPMPCCCSWQSDAVLLQLAAPCPLFPGGETPVDRGHGLCRCHRGAAAAALAWHGSAAASAAAARLCGDHHAGEAGPPPMPRVNPCGGGGGHCFVSGWGDTRRQGAWGCQRKMVLPRHLPLWRDGGSSVFEGVESGGGWDSVGGELTPPDDGT